MTPSGRIDCSYRCLPVPGGHDHRLHRLYPLSTGPIGHDCKGHARERLGACETGDISGVSGGEKLVKAVKAVIRSALARQALLGESGKSGKFGGGKAAIEGSTSLSSSLPPCPYGSTPTGKPTFSTSIDLIGGRRRAQRATPSSVAIPILQTPQIAAPTAERRVQPVRHCTHVGSVNDRNHYVRVAH